MSLSGLRAAILQLALLRECLSRREKSQILVNFALRIFVVLFDILGLLLIGLLVAGVSGENFPISIPVDLGFDFGQDFGILVICVAIFFTAKSVSSAYLMYWLATVLANIEARLSEIVAGYFFRNGGEVIRRHSPGEILWATGGSTSALVSQSLGSVANAIGDLALLLSVVCVFFALDPRLAIYTIAYFLLVSFVYMIFVSNKVKELNRASAEGSTKSSGIVQMLLGVFNELYTRGSTDFFLNHFREARMTMARAFAGITFVNGLPRVVLESAMFLGIFLLLLPAGLGSGAGFENSGIVVVLVGSVRIVAALIPLQRSVTDFRGFIEQAQAARLVLENVRSLRAEDDLWAPPTRVARNGVGVVLEGVKYSYPDSKFSSLSNVTLTILPGEFCAIAGASGAGKSTLLELIIGLLSPQAGTVELNGLTPRQFILQNPGVVGYVPQNPGMVPGSILDNIELGSHKLSPHQLRMAVRAAGVSDFVQSFPEGLATNIGKQRDGLSGGQMQRLAIARALATGPKLLILDEPTSSLDSKSEARFVDRVLHKDGIVTKVVVAHRLSTIQRADKVIVLDAGKIVDVGTFEELRTRNRQLIQWIKAARIA